MSDPHSIAVVRRIGTVVVTGLVIAGLIAASPADATTASRAVVVDSNKAVFWDGHVSSGGPVDGAIPECEAVACDHVRLKVRLPRKLKDRPGGVQVALRYPQGLFGDSLALHVYKGGESIRSSAGQVGTSQSLELPKNDASYDVYVAWNPLFSVSPALDYEGLAENEDRPPVRPVRELLPDLTVLPQRSATFDQPAEIFGDSAPAGSSCFASEIAEQGAQLCLRVGQAGANIGSGPSDVRWSVVMSNRAPEEPAVQRVYRSDGSFRQRSAGVMQWHAVHLHYHFAAFSQSSLYAIAANGLASGPPVATGQKNGFCMADTEIHWWGLKGDAPQTYPAPRCLEPQQVIAGRGYFMNGISRGWADEYMWDLPDQMIEVSGVSDGDYLLVQRLDPEDKLLEENENNNCLMSVVRLKNLASPTPTATLVGDAKPCEQAGQAAALLIE